VQRKSDHAPLQFRGPPGSLEGLLQVSQHEAVVGVTSLEVKIPGAVSLSSHAQLQTVPAGGSASWLRFALPESVPPGRYDGSLRFAGDLRPIVVEVEPRHHVLLAPRRISVMAHPGKEDIETRFFVLNQGNVDCDIPAEDTFAVFDEAAAGAGLVAALADGDGPMAVRMLGAMQNMLEHYRGMVKVQVTAGSGRLAPGQSREMTVAFRLPKIAKPGGSFSGAWVLGHQAVPCHFELIPAAKAKEKAR
jgi:hypothetical protein